MATIESGGNPPTAAVDNLVRGFVIALRHLNMPLNDVGAGASSSVHPWSRPAGPCEYHP